MTLSQTSEQLAACANLASSIDAKSDWSYRSRHSRGDQATFANQISAVAPNVTPEQTDDELLAAMANQLSCCIKVFNFGAGGSEPSFIEYTPGLAAGPPMEVFVLRVAHRRFTSVRSLPAAPAASSAETQHSLVTGPTIFPIAGQDVDLHARAGSHVSFEQEGGIVRADIENKPEAFKVTLSHRQGGQIQTERVENVPKQRLRKPQRRPRNLGQSLASPGDQHTTSISMPEGQELRHRTSHITSEQPQAATSMAADEAVADESDAGRVAAAAHDQAHDTTAGADAGAGTPAEATAIQPPPPLASAHEEGLINPAASMHDVGEAAAIIDAASESPAVQASATVRDYSRMPTSGGALASEVTGASIGQHDDDDYFMMLGGSSANENEPLPPDVITTSRLLQYVTELTKSLPSSFRAESLAFIRSNLKKWSDSVSACAAAIEAGQAHTVAFLAGEMAGKSTLINQMLTELCPQLCQGNAGLSNSRRYTVSQNPWQIRMPGPESSLFDISQITDEDDDSRDTIRWSFDTLLKWLSEDASSELHTHNQLQHGHKGLAPTRPNDDPCTGAPVIYVGRPNLSGFEITVRYQAESAVEARLAELRTLLDDSSDANADAEITDVDLLELNAFLGLPPSFDRDETRKHSNVLPVWLKNFLGQEVTFKTSNGEDLRLLLLALTTGKWSSWPCIEGFVEARMQATREFRLADLPGLGKDSRFHAKVLKKALRELNTSLYVMVVGPGRNIPEDVGQHLRDNPYVLAKLADPASGAVAHTVFCPTKETGCMLSQISSKLQHQGVDIARKLAAKTLADQRKKPWATWLLREVQNYRRKTEEGNANSSEAALLQGLCHPWVLDVTSRVFDQNPALRDVQELKDCQLSTFVAVLLDQQDALTAKVEAEVQEKLWRIATEVFLLADCAIDGERLQSDSVNNVFRQLGVAAETMSHEIGPEWWQNRRSDRLRSRQASPSIANLTAAGVRAMRHNLDRLAHNALHTCTFGQAEARLIAHGPWSSGEPELYHKYRMLNNRLLGSHLKCTDLTYPNTPIPYLLAKDVIECLPTNIRNAIKTWFSEEARYLENSFVESCIKLFEPPNSDMLQDGERAQIVYLLEINHLQLKQHMQLARETAVAQMDAFLDKLLDVTLAKAVNGCMQPDLHNILRNTKRNSEKKTEEMLKQSPVLAKRVASELVDRTIEYVELLRRYLETQGNEEIKRVTEVFKSGQQRMEDSTECKLWHTACREVCLDIPQRLDANRSRVVEAYQDSDTVMKNMVQQALDKAHQWSMPEFVEHMAEFVAFEAPPTPDEPEAKRRRTNPCSQPGCPGDSNPAYLLQSFRRNMCFLCGRRAQVQKTAKARAGK